jgi:hypothetical protein
MSVRHGPHGAPRVRDDDDGCFARQRCHDQPDGPYAPHVAPHEPLTLPHRHNLLPKLVLCCYLWWVVLSCGAVVLVVASAFGRGVDLAELAGGSRADAARTCAASFRLTGTPVTPAHVHVAVLHALESTSGESTREDVRAGAVSRSSVGSFDSVPLSLLVRESLVQLSVDPCDGATRGQLASDQFVFELGVFLARLRPGAAVSRA